MNKHAIITGGANGIGYQIANHFSKKGIVPIILDCEKYNESKFDNFKTKPFYFNVDLRDQKTLLAVIDKVKEFSINYLINNAAVHYTDTFNELSMERFDDTFKVNLFSTVLLCKELSKTMPKNSQIINISSVHSSVPRLDRYAYDAAKAALEQFSKELALTLAPKILVNCYSFGATCTPMNGNFADKKRLRESVARIPMKKVLSAEEAGRQVVLFATNNKYSTGEVIVLDGGRSLK